MTGSSALGRLAAVGAVLTMCGCATGAQPHDTSDVVAAVSVSPVTAQRGDVTSVVTVDVVAVARPEHAVLAPQSGAVRLGKGIGPGSTVAAGQEILTVEGAPVLATVAGVVTSLLVETGTRVHLGIPLAVVRYEGFGVTGAVPVDEAYRLASGETSARVQFADGPGTTDCSPVPLVDATADATADSEARRGQDRLKVMCLLPDPTGVVAGLPGVLGITTGHVEGVLTLPLTAVAGSSRHGSVSLVVDGATREVPVRLGITDGAVIEIVEGLTEGDEVLPFGPTLRQQVAP